MGITTGIQFLFHHENKLPHDYLLNILSFLKDLQYHFYYNIKVPFRWGFVSSISILFSWVNSTFSLLQAIYQKSWSLACQMLLTLSFRSILTILGPLPFRTHFRFSLLKHHTYKNHWFFIEIMLTQQVNLRRTDMFMILSLCILEHDIFVFYLGFLFMPHMKIV